MPAGSWGAPQGSRDQGISCTFSSCFAPRGTLALALVQSGLCGLCRAPHFPHLFWSQEGQVHCPLFLHGPTLAHFHTSTLPCSTCAATKHFLQLPSLLAQLGELSSDFLLLLLQPFLLLCEPFHLCLCPVLAQLGFHRCCWKHSPTTTSSVREKEQEGENFSGAWKENKGRSEKSPATRVSTQAAVEQRQVEITGHHLSLSTLGPPEQHTHLAVASWAGVQAGDCPLELCPLAPRGTPGARQ